MVTFERIIKTPSEGTPLVINTEGCFVVPVNWLYVMTKSKKVRAKQELFNKDKFTDEMLLDMILDFKDYQEQGGFSRSPYFNVGFAVCEWQKDRKWYGYAASGKGKTVIHYKREDITVDDFVYLRGQDGKLYNNQSLHFDPKTEIGARNNLRYWKVISRFTPNLEYLDVGICSQTIVNS